MTHKCKTSLLKLARDKRPSLSVTKKTVFIPYLENGFHCNLGYVDELAAML
jgi:hypothetical protein